LAALRLRDRDAIVTGEGLIFRVFGYSHLPQAYVCDVEYAPAEIFSSQNPKAFRSKGKNVFYKFYEDEGWKFIKSNFPQYMIFHKTLCGNVIGVRHSDILKVRKPDATLSRLNTKESKDDLLIAMEKTLEIVTNQSKLSTSDFGVFGSMLHGFYNPKFSDIDLIVFGEENLTELREVLQEQYEHSHSTLRNEFESSESIRGKRWRFKNYTTAEFVQHQKRKMIYGLFSDVRSRRIIKVEFEPVKDWAEIRPNHLVETKITRKGWVKMLARITEDENAPFIPSVYSINPLTVLQGTRGADEATRVVSYLEEFRLQAQKDEKVYIEGNLEKVMTSDGSFTQVTLTYCPKYYEQVLKVTS
jgi:predicted nucleotidyltransferase